MGFENSDPNFVNVRFRISNPSDLLLSIEDIYLQLMTCTKSDFAMSEGEGSIKEQRINLGQVSFDNNVSKLGDKDIIYTIKEQRSAFFKFSYDYNLVQREKKSDCKQVSKDVTTNRKGDLYLLVRAINPQTGQSFIMRKKV